MDVHKPLISYVIPLFNHENFIQDALNSILEDNYYKRELIVIDDGSTDRSVEKVNIWALQNPQIHLTFISRENKGLPATLNELISLCRGEYIRILASDDKLLPNSSEFLLSEFIKKPGLACVFSECKVINENGSIVAESSLAFRGASSKMYHLNLKESLITHWASSGACLLIQKSIFLKNFPKYDESLLIEDWYMFLTLSAKNLILFVPGKVALYRIHSNNKSRTKNISERVSGLQHLKTGLEKCLNLYQGRNFRLLNAQISLLSAKILFLKKNYLASSFYITKFIFLRFLPITKLLN